MIHQVRFGCTFFSKVSIFYIYQKNLSYLSLGSILGTVKLSALVTQIHFKYQVDFSLYCYLLLCLAICFENYTQVLIEMYKLFSRVCMLLSKPNNIANTFFICKNLEYI